mgnify:CR=1 FL=1
MVFPAQPHVQSLLASTEDAPPRRLMRRYLLVCPIPHEVRVDGSIWIDRLWHRDLVEHLRYLPQLVIACPAAATGPGSDGERVKLDVPPENSLRIHILPYGNTTNDCLRTLPRLIRELWRAVGNAEVVHSGVAGWPIPLGWIANPIARLRRRKLVIVVESSFWRVPEGTAAPWTRRLRAAISERFARISVRMADLALFTHTRYRDELHGAPGTAAYARETAHVTPAVWVKGNDVIGTADAQALWDRRLSDSAAPLRFLFAGRFEDVKGIGVLLDALKLLEARGAHLRVDVVGAGARRPAVLEVAQSLSRVEMRVLDAVPYGAAFFGLLSGYHALIVPSLSDEQPRIVFDGFSQALPIIAARTAGLVDLVVHEETGVLVERGDADALARALARLAEEPAALRRMGMAACAAAARHTHEGMHDHRRDLLIEAFGA